MRRMGSVLIGLAILVGALSLSSSVLGSNPPAFTSDGQVFFPVGWYSTATEAVGTASDLDGKRTNAISFFNSQLTAGMNTILPSGAYKVVNDTDTEYYGTCDNTTAQAILEAADQTGMKLIFPIDPDCFFLWYNYAWPYGVQNHIDHVVNAAKGHSSLLMWYLFDEPSDNTADLSTGHYITTQGMLDAYNRIRGDEGLVHRPQMVVHYASAEFNKAWTYNLFGGDCYPVQTGTAEFSTALWRVPVLAKECIALKPGVPYAAVLQGYDNYSTSWNPSLWGRLPTYNEQRYMACSALVEGARGLLWWTSNLCTNPNYTATVIGPLSQQVASLKYALASNSTTVAVTSNHNTDTTGHGLKDINCIFGEDNYGAYVIAVNNTNTTINNVAFTLTGVPSGYQSSVTVKFESRSLTPSIAGSTWTITDNFTPYAAHVYYIARTSALVPVLNISPASRTVFGEGQTTFTVSNSGQGVMPWSATVTNGSGWLTISDNATTITASFKENTTGVDRTGTIRVTAGEGATGTPVDITVVQLANYAVPSGAVDMYIGGPSMQDVYIVADNSSNPGDPLAQSMILRESSDVDSSYDSRGFVKVDLSDLPAGATIDYVELGLWYVNAYGGSNVDSLYVCYVTDEFDAGSLNYLTYNGSNLWTAGRGAGIDPCLGQLPNLIDWKAVDPSSPNRWVKFNSAALLSYIRTQYNAGKAAYFALAINDPSGLYQLFTSSEYRVDSSRPYLRVVFETAKTPITVEIKGPASFDSVYYAATNNPLNSPGAGKANMDIADYFMPNSVYDVHGFIKIDLSSIPANKPITNAELGLWHGGARSGTGSKTVLVGSCVDEFSTTTLNYFTYDGTNAWTDGVDAGLDGYLLTNVARNKHIVATFTVDGAVADVQKTVNSPSFRDYIKAQVLAGKSAYLTFCYNDAGSGDRQWFWTEHYADNVSKQPYLRVTYLQDAYNVSGTVNLGSFTGDRTTVPVTVQLKQGSTVVSTQSITLNSSGQFTVTGVAPGTYDVRVKASHWLAQTRSLTVASGNATIASAYNLVNGDVNNDNGVNTADLSAVLAALDTTSTTTDLDGDSAVGSTDLSIVLANLDQIGS